MLSETQRKALHELDGQTGMQEYYGNILQTMIVHISDTIDKMLFDVEEKDTDNLTKLLFLTMTTKELKPYIDVVCDYIHQMNEATVQLNDVNNTLFELIKQEQIEQ